MIPHRDGISLAIPLEFLLKGSSGIDRRGTFIVVMQMLTGSL
jgi:hypothetical protein